MSLFHQLQDRFADAIITPDELAEEYQNLTLPPIEETRPASVLVGFVDRPDPTLLLTRRQAHLRSHAGQVAFPGGRVDEGDANAVATALRESWEEVALPPDADPLALTEGVEGQAHMTPHLPSLVVEDRARCCCDPTGERPPEPVRAGEVGVDGAHAPRVATVGQRFADVLDEDVEQRLGHGCPFRSRFDGGSVSPCFPGLVF